VIEEENLQQNSLEVGTYLLKGFESLRDKYDLIGDVRGKVSKFNPVVLKPFSSLRQLHYSLFHLHCCWHFVDE
jgi:acetylornithine/succinyldiaminopimelate/putrescine aminotransferase